MAQAVNDAIQWYIVDHAIMSIKTSPNSFKSFYCNTVFGSNTFNNVTNMCEVAQEMCTANAATAENYKQRFREDFGDYYSTLALESMLEKCGKSSSYIPTVPSSQSIQITDTQTKIYPSALILLRLCFTIYYTGSASSLMSSLMLVAAGVMLSLELKI